ncbi:hypothetical protein ACEPAI_9274 [Sanghuangporus weigelae]
MPYPTPEPVPDPGLVGDLVNGVGDVVNNAVSGVVGLVTTVLGDVNKLVAPARTSVTTAAPDTSVPSAPSTSQAMTASPNATPTPTSGGGNSGSSSGSSGLSGDNGGSNGSSGDSGSTNGSNSNGNTPPNGNGSTNGSTSNNGSSSNSDSGSSNSDRPSSNPPGSVSDASGIPSASGGTNGLESSLISGPTLSASASASASASVSRSDVVNLAQSSASLSGTAATAAPVINAVESVGSEDQSDSTLLSGARGATTTRNTLHTSLPTGSSGSGPGSGSNGDANGNSAASSNHGLSPGIIAAIAIISSLAFLALVVFVTRRWYRKRRERRFENWVSRPGAFAFFGAASVNINNENDEKSEGAASGSGTRSARSSFGTTIDRGLRPLTPDPFSRSASNFSDFYSAANTSMTFLAPSPVPAPLVATPPVQRPESAINRQSLISLASSSSSSYGSGGGSGPNDTSTEAVAEDRDGSTDDHAQYLIVAASQSQNHPNAPQPSPISVRPWSPSERWAFPKPPSGTSALGNIFYPPPTSPVSQSVESDRVPASHLPPLTPVTSTAPEATNPFADPSQIPDEVTSGTCESAVAAKTSVSGTDGIVGAIEHIRRPFLPTLVDELRVQRGDVIRVLQVFDDGWVQVEKISDATGTSGAETTTFANERGLIPVDCLREAGEPLPDFLASRRVSSYYGFGVAILTYAMTIATWVSRPPQRTSLHNCTIADCGRTKDAGKLTLRSGFELHTNKYIISP